MRATVDDGREPNDEQPVFRGVDVASWGYERTRRSGGKLGAEEFVTVTLELPPHIEQAYRAEAEARGLPLNVVVTEALVAQRPKSIFEQGLGLFSGQEDAALLDEVVRIAYEERKRPAESTRCS